MRLQGRLKTVSMNKKYMFNRSKRKLEQLDNNTVEPVIMNAIVPCMSYNVGGLHWPSCSYNITATPKLISILACMVNYIDT